MPKTVLAIVQDFTAKLGLPRPNALVGSGVPSVLQFRQLLQEAIDALVEYPWEGQKLRRTWTSLAGEDQGPLTTIFGAGYNSIIPETMWNETRRMRIYGPLQNATWQALQTLPAAGPEFQSWISGGRLYVTPDMVAGETLSAIYTTRYGVLAVDGVTTREEIAADDDSLLFPHRLVTTSLEWRWRKQKGERGWEDDYNTYITLVSRALNKSGGPTLSLESKPAGGFRPGIVIPPGSWNV